MEVLNISIDWMKKWANEPRIFVDIDKWVRPAYVYDEKKHKGGTAYFASSGLFADFCFHDPNYEHGYGGGVFDHPMRDGSTRKVKGPWSSCPAQMVALGFPETVDVVLRAGSSLLSGCLVAEELLKLWAKIGPSDAELIKVGGGYIAHPKVGCISQFKEDKRYRCPVCNPERRSGYLDPLASSDQMAVILS